MSIIPHGLSLHDALSCLPPEVRAIVNDHFYDIPFTLSELTRLGRVNKDFYARITPKLYNTISLDQRNSDLSFYPSSMRE
ncbi:hypothetical protein IAR50_003826 [Cryptococcus sp. DSM 104548]